MRAPIVIPIKLAGGMTPAFGRISHLNGAFLLDSATTGTKDSRYSFAGANPVHTFTSNGGFITIDGHTVIDRPREALQRLVSLVDRQGMDPYLPFSGGLVGFVSCEWARARGDVVSSETTPDVSFGLYDTVVTYDHLEGAAWVSSLGLTEDGSTSESLAKERAEGFVEMLSYGRAGSRMSAYPPLFGSHPVIPSLNKDAFIGAIQTLRHVKHSPLFAERFTSPTHKDPWQIYLKLRDENPTPFAAYLNCGAFHVLSSSRTRLIKISDGLISTQPTKGCIGRNKSAEDDRMRINELRYNREKQASHRHLVTNTMTAMESVCEIGSIEPLDIAHVETDARAHHLVSNITAWKHSYANALDCLLAIMPTATEERGVLDLISKLEAVPRSVYTGAIGFMGNGRAEFNLAFRTLVLKDTIGYLHVGTEVDSHVDPEEVYLRADNTADNMFNLINKSVTHSKSYAT